MKSQHAQKLNILIILIVVLLATVVGFIFIKAKTSYKNIAEIITPASQTAQVSSIITDGLIAWWKFDEGTGTTATDSSVQIYTTKTNHIGTLLGPTWVDSKYGKGLSFNGTSDYVSLTTNSAKEINSSSSPVTYSVWINPSANSGFIFHSPRRFVLYNGQLQFEAANTTSSLIKYSSNNAFPLNQWVHVAATWDGTINASGVHLYVNGVETTYSSSVNGVGVPITSTSFLIGKYNYANTPTQYFKGIMDDISIYNRVLSQSEIQNLYNSAQNLPSEPTPITPINTAPTIQTSTIQNVVLPNSLVLNSFITDDNLPQLTDGPKVNTTWSYVSGPEVVHGQTDNLANTVVNFNSPGTYVFRITANDGELSSYKNVTVNVKAPLKWLIVQKSGSGNGSVKVNGIDCEMQCLKTFDNSTSVTLTASPSDGSGFRGWVGNGCSGTGTCTIQIDSIKTISAIFDTLTTGTRVLYVDQNNPEASNTNPGTLSTKPLKTIQRAADIAVAGDRIMVKAGVYNEFVSLKNNGLSSTKPIVFEGERSSNGDWLTIIDPSTSVKNGWVLAPEIGPYVYKKTDMPFETHEMTIDNKRIAFVWTMGNMASDINEAYDQSGLTTGADFLALPSDKILKSKFTVTNIRFWDGIEALYGASGNTTYLRFRDNRDPNGMNIRVAPNNVGSLANSDQHFPVVDMSNKSYIHFRNFMIRGAIGGVFLNGVSTHDNVIENNNISNGYSRITLATGAYSNVIQNNEMTNNFYGYSDQGAWGSSDYHYQVRGNQYVVSKFLMGSSSTFDAGVNIANAGNNNKIDGNHIYKGLGTGVGLRGLISNRTQNTEISNNIIENEPSVGIILSEGQTKTKVHDNILSDNNINLRFHHADYDGETERIVYAYRNKFWLPQNEGEHIYVHFYNDTMSNYQPEFWVYQNSFSGGQAAFVPSGYAEGNGGLPGFRFINNIFSGAYYYDQFTRNLATVRSMLGYFDHNIITPPYSTYPITGDPAWFAQSNKKTNALWSLDVIPDFKVSSVSDAVDNGLKLNENIGNITYSSLPGMSTYTVYGNAPDIGAYEYQNSVNNNPVSPVPVNIPTSSNSSTPTQTTTGSQTTTTTVNNGGGGGSSSSSSAGVSTPSTTNQINPTTSTPQCLSVTPFTRNLSLGSSGDDVKALQVFLNRNGFIVATLGTGSSGKESTYFGEATKAAVIRFQNKYASEILNTSTGEKATGIVGTNTLRKLNSLLNSTNNTNGLVSCIPVSGSTVSPNPNPSSLVNSSGSYTRNLTIGSRGEDVKRLQIFLNSRGYKVALTGVGSSGKESTYFGPATRSALAKFQAANGITPAAGYFGVKSRELIK